MKVKNPTDTPIRISLLDGFSVTVAPKKSVELHDSRLGVCLYHGLVEVKKPKGKSNGV